MKFGPAKFGIPFTLLGIMLIMALIPRVFPEQNSMGGAQAIIALGFTLIVSYLFGKLFVPLKLPQISGYLFAGILIGPFFLNLVSVQRVRELQLIDLIALALIALTAGGELRMSRLRLQKKFLLQSMCWMVVLVPLLCLAVIMAGKPLIPLLQNISMISVVGVGLLFGVLAISASPATTIAVITETQAHGPFSEGILSLTIAIDMVVVLLFAVVLAVARPLVLPGQALEFFYLLKVLKEIGLSLLGGVFLGLLIYLYLRFVRTQAFLFIMGLILLTVEIHHALHLEIILVFIVAGFIIQNFSRQGNALIEAIEANSLPVYAVFFAIAGASLNFDIFLANWAITFALVLARLGGIAGSVYLGAKDIGKQMQRNGWMGLSGQAGVTLGLAVILRQSIPGNLGQYIQSVIVAGIAINQMVGPVLFRFALSRAGEISTPEEYGKNPLGIKAQERL